MTPLEETASKESQSQSLIEDIQQRIARLENTLNPILIPTTEDECKEEINHCKLIEGLLLIKGSLDKLNSRIDL